MISTHAVDTQLQILKYHYSDHHNQVQEAKTLLSAFSYRKQKTLLGAFYIFLFKFLMHSVGWSSTLLASHHYSHSHSSYVIIGRWVPLKLHVEGVAVNTSIWKTWPTTAALHLCMCLLQCKFQVGLDTVDFITEQLELFLQVIKSGISWMWSCNETVHHFAVVISSGTVDSHAQNLIDTLQLLVLLSMQLSFCGRGVQNFARAQIQISY